jgi:hypothetical protein
MDCHLFWADASVAKEQHRMRRGMSFLICQVMCTRLSIEAQIQYLDDYTVLCDNSISTTWIIGLGRLVW